MNALKMPLDREPDRLVKKDTVSGIMGKVQGMIRPTRPPRKPNIKIPSRLFDWLFSVPVPPHGWAGCARSIEDFFRLLEAVEDSSKPADRATRPPGVTA